MKFLLVLSALFVAINALSDHEAWSDFKVQHGKTYQNKVEELRRFQIFQENLRRIEEHNAKYEKGEVSYYFGVNHFADMSSEEFMAYLNKQIAGKPHIKKTARFEHEKFTAPEKVDWRSTAVLNVKDQGQCGSCWAFSATGALEGQLLIKKNQSSSLSEQELVDCSTDRPYQNDGCGGGAMQSAFEYIIDHGLSSEESYPYTAEDGECRKGTKVVESISDYTDVATNENALQTAVGNVGPISIGLYADNNWQLYAGGIFDHAECGDDLNHGVLAVGYDNADNKDYWIIKNSWGPKWGEAGYIRLVRGKNQCGINLDACYPQL